MAKFFNPDGMAPPQAKYHHGVLVPTGTQTLYIAGQLGVDSDGNIADGIEEQSRWAFRNLATVLESAFTRSTRSSCRWPNRASKSSGPGPQP